MNRLARFPSTAAVLFTVLLSLFAVPEAGAQSMDAWILTNNSLVMIDTADPAAAGAPLPVTGLNAGDTLVGIDFRPVNGYLYGLGFNSGAGTLQLYNVSWRTGVATPIGATGTFVGFDGVTPVSIAGAAFGFDFDPMTDRLRIVNDTGQHFRMDPNTGAFLDGDLGGSPGGVPGLNMDVQINGGPAGADGVAYTNNIVGRQSTTLYTLDSATNALYIQNPPNGGTATTPRAVTLNGSPLDFTSANGFDIGPEVGSHPYHAPAPGDGHAVLTVGGTTSLYTVNLTSGIAALAGPIGNGTVPVQGFAIWTLRAIGVHCSGQGVALIQSNRLRTINLAGCGASGGFGGTIPITGLVAGETVVAIDFRPQTGQLFGLGFDASSGSGSATLYRLDPTTSAATIIGAPGSVANGTGTPIDLAGATAFGFDFNPTVDRIRVVTSGLNFRINPNDGTVVGGALDSPINGLPVGSQGVAGAAYTNSYGQSLTGGVTTLYTLDPGSDRLYIQNPANAGTQTAGIPVILDGQPFDFTNVVAFDIAPGIRVTSSGASATGAAHAVLGYGTPPLGGNATVTVMLDLDTGIARPVSLTIHGEVRTGLAMGDSPRNPTTVTLTSSAPGAAIGQPVTFTATVTPPPAVGVSISPLDATGTIAFNSAGAPITGCGAQPITGMIATCTTSFVTPGAVQIVAAFAGDTIHRGSTSTPLNQIVGLATSTTSLTVTPNPAQVGQAVIATATVNPAWATGTIAFHLDGNIVTTANVSAGKASATFNNLTVGTHQIQAGYSGSALVAASPSAPVTVTIAAAGPVTQHFAEGATGFMQTDVGIFNANVSNAAVVNVKLLPEVSDPVDLVFYLDALERRSLDVNAIVQSLGVPDQGFSILVESTQPVAATRQMTWGDPVYGSTLESGIASAAPTWYFAEGATNIFSLYYMVENPNATPANVTLTHLLEGGGAPITQTEVVPPFTRRTFDINAVPGLASAALSTIVASDVPIVAERAMYLNTTNRLWEGGAVGRGAPALNSFWSFAEGATGFFHTYLCMGNPNDGTANVTVTYKLASGETLSKQYSVPGKSRLTIDVNGEDAQLASTDVGMTISSSRQIVAERAMWWGGLPWSEGSVSIGSTATGTVWAIGEGAEGGSSDESTFVQVANGGNTQGTLRFTIAYDDGTHEQSEHALLANARLTVRITDDFPNAVGKKFSVLVESLTNGVPITVEYARYQSPGVFGAGGGAALATRIR